MNNSIFGKSLENKQNRLNVKLCTDKKWAIKYSSLPHADSFRILGDELVQLNLRQRSVLCDLPTYLGFSILELTKLLMYEFHYEYIRPKYEERAQLLFTDTDSLCYCIETGDIYEDMKNDKERFDTSNYPPDHTLSDSTNKQVLGKMKDEMGGVPVEEFVGLRSKMYSLKTRETTTKKAKGIARRFVKKHLSHEDYVSALTATEVQRGTWTKITSTGHQLATASVTKTLLCPYDDKRYILEDGVSTRAIGHIENSTTFEEFDDTDDFNEDQDVLSDGEEEEAKAVAMVEEAEAELNAAREAEEATKDTRRITLMTNRARSEEERAEARKGRQREVMRKIRAEMSEAEKESEKVKNAEAMRRKYGESSGREKQAQKRKAMTVEEREEANKKRRLKYEEEKKKKKKE